MDKWKNGTAIKNCRNKLFKLMDVAESKKTYMTSVLKSLLNPEVFNIQLNERIMNPRIKYYLKNLKKILKGDFVDNDENNELEDRKNEVEQNRDDREVEEGNEKDKKEGSKGEEESSENKEDNEDEGSEGNKGGKGDENGKSDEGSKDEDKEEVKEIKGIGMNDYGYEVNKVFNSLSSSSNANLVAMLSLDLDIDIGRSGLDSPYPCPTFLMSQTFIWTFI
ncbi:hypothetical protein C1645_824804 [Glomus cerebriforme]|uniref:Uncharacterized protein n=1 Tax=Glomus cerebriforme TaxID=658196 RepID=A0A397T2V6_9GLOM|nr:hypothetical protein C1645_824804 [Glomus cerebriforme]